MDEYVNQIQCRPAPLVLLAAILAGCGSSHHGGTTTPSNGPTISDLGVATLAPGCIVQGLPGKARTVNFSFTDPDGNESGGHVDLTLSGGGPTQSLTVAVPSSGVTLSGSTSGTITLSGLCIAVVGGSATLSVSLTDAAGNQSNTVSTAVAGLRPAAGAPGASRALDSRAIGSPSGE
jgi:hypothetical protein